MALAAAVSPLAAENDSRECGVHVHGDTIFYFCLCDFFHLFVLSLRYLTTYVR